MWRKRVRVMSKYTTELRYIIESGYKLNALTSYPIFDENYRSVLNQYILNHFWMREIGFETAGEFDLYLGNTLNEIMPYYNGMFKMAMSEIDPLTNYKYKETLDKSDVGTTNSISNTSGNSKSVESTPADGLVQMNEIENNVYASSATLNNNTVNAIGTADSKTETDYVKLVSGYNGVSVGKLYDEYRRYVVSVVRLLMNDKDLNQCFLGVY
nr:MAG TPA: Lower collar protein [Caudoviricetes sp.]